MVGAVRCNLPRNSSRPPTITILDGFVKNAQSFVNRAESMQALKILSHVLEGIVIEKSDVTCLMHSSHTSLIASLRCSGNPL